jgi:hypothetical protein
LRFPPGPIFLKSKESPQNEDPKQDFSQVEKLYQLYNYITPVPEITSYNGVLPHEKSHSNSWLSQLFTSKKQKDHIEETGFFSAAFGDEEDMNIYLRYGIHPKRIFTTFEKRKIAVNGKGKRYVMNKL